MGQIYSEGQGGVQWKSVCFAYLSPCSPTPVSS